MIRHWWWLPVTIPLALVFLAVTLIRMPLNLILHFADEAMSHFAGGESWDSGWSWPGWALLRGWT